MLAGAALALVVVPFASLLLLVQAERRPYIVGAAWATAMTAVLGAWRRDEGKPGVSVISGLEPEHAEQLDARSSSRS